MIFWKHAAGIVQAELTGADVTESLSSISKAGIQLNQIIWIDPMTVCVTVARRDQKKLKEICQKQGDGLRFCQEEGLASLLRKLIQRPVLAAGFLFLFLLTLFLPTRVLFVRVEGNEQIPEQEILAAAEACGIRFGAARRSVRSEKMKNALLAALPELKWAGVNTSGCAAVISVREREIPEESDPDGPVSSIVAARDGYVTSCTVTRGKGLCLPGQIVREGQVLISGYNDCGICIQVTQAQGEIFAETSRSFQAVMPSECLIRLYDGSLAKRFSLNLGKKRINFWKDSGISDATCGRMYKEYYITLPGGFRLPVSIGVETITHWEAAAMEISKETVEEKLMAFARESLLDQMISGRILHEDQTLIQESSSFLLESSFLCSEMIGRVITQEIGEINGKTD